MPSRLGSLAQSTKDRIIKKIKEMTEKQIDKIPYLDMSVSAMISDLFDTINHDDDSSRRECAYIIIGLRESIQDIIFNPSSIGF